MTSRKKLNNTTTNINLRKNKSNGIGVSVPKPLFHNLLSKYIHTKKSGQRPIHRHETDKEKVGI